MGPALPTRASSRLGAITLAILAIAGLAFAGARLAADQRERRAQSDARLQQQADVGGALLSSAVRATQSTLATRYARRLDAGTPSVATLRAVARRAGSDWARLYADDGTVVATTPGPPRPVGDPADVRLAARTIARPGHRRPSVAYEVRLGRRVLELGFAEFSDATLMILKGLPGPAASDVFVVGARGEVIGGRGADGRSLTAPPLTAEQLRDAGAAPVRAGDQVASVARVRGTPWSVVARADRDDMDDEATGAGGLLSWLLLGAAGLGGLAVLGLTLRAGRSAELLAQERERAVAVLSVLDDGFLFTRNGRVVDVNTQLCAIAAVRPDELIGADAAHPLVAGLLRLPAASPGHEVHTTITRADGTLAEVAIRTRELPGAVDSRVSVVRDIGVQKREERRLAQLATTDALTGLANRGAFDHALCREAALAGHDLPLSLVLFDVDHFKAVNDAHGHPVGDRVLTELARRLAGSVRDGDVVARIGGEEFAWLLPNCPPAAAAELADRARRESTAAPIAGVGHVTLSAGVSAFTGGDARDLYVAADTALMAAKRGGRDRTELRPPAAAPRS